MPRIDRMRTSRPMLLADGDTADAVSSATSYAAAYCQERLGHIVGRHARTITLAVAMALPPAFPYLDLIVLTAFAVVLRTLVVQGLTLKPLLAGAQFARR